MQRGSVFLMVVALVVSLLAPQAAVAAGPWQAQVVDAETGQPLEGVVVLMYWIKYTGSFAGWAGGEFYDAEEVVTGPDGRFVVPSRWVFTLNPFKKVTRDMVIFKPGYGHWRFRDAMEWEKLPDWERKARREEAGKQFEGEGVVKVIQRTEGGNILGKGTVTDQLVNLPASRKRHSRELCSDAIGNTKLQPQESIEVRHLGRR